MVEVKTDNKIKICHVTSAHNRYDIRIFLKECKSLSKHGYDVTLLVNDKYENEIVDGVSIVSTLFAPKNRFDRIIKSKKYIKKKMIDINAEIYHFHDPELLPVASWIKNRGRKVIFDFHEDVSQQILFKSWIPKVLRSTVSLLYRKYEEFLIKKFDAIISVTPKFIDRLKKINSNTVMITNYPIINYAQTVNYRNRKRAICFAGGISPQWNHENIIRAIEDIDDIEYILAGNGSVEYIDKLKKLKGWKKVRYLGRVPHEEVSDIYREAMIGMTLLSNDTQVGDEGTLGNTKIFEYMEAGLPVICSNSLLWMNLVDTYKFGISISATELTRIRKAINYILNNSETAKEMSENGMKATKEIFNWSSQEIKLFQIYNELFRITI